MDLQRILEEKTEELEGWRLRCLQAEAEVRALKRAGKALVVGTGGSRPSEPAPAPAPKDSEEVLALRAELQRLKDERTAESMQQPKEDLQAALARGNGMTAEVSELRKELQMRSEALLELQEQSSREAKRLDRQRKSAEAKQIVCHEELREMTQRAESLSEQVKKSKRRAADLQSARDESVELRRELAELRAEKAPVGSRVLATTTAAELGSSAPDEELRAALRPCFDSLRHLRGAWREQFPPNSSPSQAFERLITSLERAQQFCSTEGAGAGGSGPIPSATGTVVGKGSPFASLNPEGEHPPPEEKSHEWRIDQLQQELNEERLLGAELREELVMEHCNDLDDLVQRYDHERRELHEELRSIHQESSCAWASIQMAEPLASMKNYLETQVAKMQETLSAQMAELDQRRWEQREQDEMAMATLKERLANCLEELGASQADFKELVRQHWLEKQMRERGGQHQAGRASPATTPNPSSQASGSQGPSQGPSQGHHRQTSQTQGGSQSQGLLQQQQQQQQQQQEKHQQQQQQQRQQEAQSLSQRIVQQQPQSMQRQQGYPPSPKVVASAVRPLPTAQAMAQQVMGKAQAGGLMSIVTHLRADNARLREALVAAQRECEVLVEQQKEKENDEEMASRNAVDFGHLLALVKDFGEDGLGGCVDDYDIEEPIGAAEVFCMDSPRSTTDEEHDDDDEGFYDKSFHKQDEVTILKNELEESRREVEALRAELAAARGVGALPTQCRPLCVAAA